MNWDCYKKSLSLILKFKKNGLIVMTIIIVTIAVTIMGLETEDHSSVIFSFWFLVSWWGNIFKDPPNFDLFRKDLK